MDAVTPARTGPIWQNLIPGDVVRVKRGRRVGEVVAVLEYNRDGQHTMVDVCWDETCRDSSSWATDCLVLVKPAPVTAPRHSPRDTTRQIADVTMDCHSRRIHLYVEDGRLRWKAPRGSMTVELLKRIKALEPDLVVHVGALQDIEEQGV